MRGRSQRNFLKMTEVTQMVESACNTGDPSLILASGRSPGEGNSNQLQNSCLGGPMDRGAWQTTVHGVPRVGQYLALKPLPTGY